MKNTDINNVDKDTLVDIRSVTIDSNLPRQERIHSYVEQIKTPYCFKYGDTIIKVSYKKTGTSLDERIHAYFMSKLE